MKDINATPKHLKKKKGEEEKISEEIKLITSKAPIHQILSKMRYRDLQRACISRGMKFDDMVNTDIIGLQSYLFHEWHRDADLTLLDKFDEWRKEYLEKKHGPGEPFVRLGYLGKSNEDGGDKEKKPIREKAPKKPKRERDETLGSIYKGTKKALTFQSIQEGKTIEETIKIVISTFPDALDKSIKIWAKRAAKELKITIPLKSSKEPIQKGRLKGKQPPQSIPKPLAIKEIKALGKTRFKEQARTKKVIAKPNRVIDKKKAVKKKK